jgi:hypothetical protein
MTRNQQIERILRLVYNGQPSDDSNITYGLVNQWLNDALGVAAKKNYTDNLQMEGIAFVNNSFYTTFSGIEITAVTDVSIYYKMQLPQIPIALGKNEGIATLQFVDTDSMKISHTAIPLSMNQVGTIDTIRPIQNKIVYWNEGPDIFAKSGILLTKYTAKIRMVSGGDSSDLNSTLIIPDDYVPIVIEYIKAQLAFEKSRPIDSSNDGIDN